MTRPYTAPAWRGDPAATADTTAEEGSIFAPGSPSLDANPSSMADDRLSDLPGSASLAHAARARAIIGAISLRRDDA